MINALELLRSQQDSASEREHRRRLSELAERKFALESSVAPVQQEGMRLSNLAKQQAIDMQPRLMARQDQQLAQQGQLQRERIASQERLAGMRGKAAPKPQWDSARGVWVMPPSEGGVMVGGSGREAGIIGAPSGQGRVVRPEGLPKTSAERKAEAEIEKEKFRLDGALSKADTILTAVGEGLQQAGPMTTGLVGDIRRTNAGRLTGSGAYDLARTVDTIKANLGFQELQAMREASPTGGALGQVAVQELTMLQATLANLDPGQSEDQLKNNLRKVQTHYRNWKDAVAKARGATGGDTQAPAAGTVSGADAEAMAWATANPNDPRAAEIKRRLGAK